MSLKQKMLMRELWRDLVNMVCPLQDCLNFRSTFLLLPNAAGANVRVRYQAKMMSFDFTGP